MEAKHVISILALSPPTVQAAAPLAEFELKADEHRHILEYLRRHILALPSPAAVPRSAAPTAKAGRYCPQAPPPTGGAISEAPPVVPFTTRSGRSATRVQLQGQGKAGQGRAGQEQ